jgi:multidrug efflux pump subunit AcrA (membrane-fusion protein)
MLLRISLIVAILAGLAAGGLGYYEVSTQVPALTKQRDDENTAKKQAQTELAQTKTKLKKTESDLAQTQQDLADTKANLDKAVARADAQEKRASDLTDKLADMTKQRDDSQNDLASYKATGLTADQVVSLNKQLKAANLQIAAINDEKMVLQRHVVVLQNKLNEILEPDNYVKLPAGLKGKIAVVDPKWDFVVLDIGDNQGAVEDGEMLVSRQGKLVAKVILRSVQKDRSIANIVPGWKIGEPIEGDDVTPAHPAS